MSEENKEQKTTEETKENEKPKFPTEIIDLPSNGKCYPEGHILSSGQIEVKYMTAREEDILTSRNLIQKGQVIKMLLDSLIVTPGVTSDDMVLGDKNAVMVAARILAYGPEYTATISHPDTGEKIEHTFDLTDCPFKKMPDDLQEHSDEYEFKLPISKLSVKFKFLTGKDEHAIEKDVAGNKKLNKDLDTTMTSRLIHSITEVDGNRDRNVVTNFVLNMLARDSFELRSEMTRVTPDIELKQFVEIGGEVVEVDIPLTTEFFWPNTL